MPDAEARFAMQLLSTNGILMGDQAGEDSVGRAAMKPMEVGPLVQRAFDIAAEAYAQARKRGCMLLLPTDEIIRAEAAKAKERARDEEERERAEKEERRRARQATENA
jgi:hypothetical protein